MTDFFTADHHFYHTKILDYCQRPFASVEEMNESLIESWNSVVSEGDTVYHLGDFGLAGVGKLAAIKRRLNGSIVLIRGNHDTCSKTAYVERLGFLDVLESMEYEVKNSDRKLYLCHYPADNSGMYDDRFSDRRPIIPHGSWLIHGHVHTAWRIDKRQINIGVDVRNYRPLSLEEICAVIDAHQGPKELAAPSPISARLILNEIQSSAQ